MYNNINMSIYNKSIIYEFNNNHTFIKIEINNDKVNCSNKEIKKDIEKKLNNINIEYVIFYVSSFDYDIIKNTYYWKTIKSLDRIHLPIYKKSDDLLEYLNWLKKNFNNNKIKIYETSKFTKRKHVFSDKDECAKSIKWEQTNLKYDNFNQLFFHAGDMDEIERYGYLYMRTAFNKILKYGCDKENIFKKKDIDIWNKFKTNFKSIKNTMFYMFNKMKKGILVGIKNNKLLIFLPFSKYNYKNDFFTELYFDENDKKNLEEYNKNPNNNLLIKLENTVKYYLNKYKLSLKNVVFDRTKWIANDCFFRYENYEGDKSEALYEDLLTELCKNRVLPDCIFFLNIRDHPVLNRNLKDSYTSIIDRDLDVKYQFEEYAPILSVGPSLETADLPLITQDDWLRVNNVYYPDDCKNGYVNSIKEVLWENKINKAVFRGSSTGCNIDESNIRIKASILSKKYPELLNAGITSYNRKIKKSLGEALKVINPTLQKADFMTLDEKATYKYILNLDGHVAAFRLGHELSLKSVILLPKSKYYLWFSNLLKPYEHYIPIEEDLNDLIDKVKWCINNDDKCKEIAINAYNFYKKYLEKDGIYDYMQNLLCKIAPTSLNFKKYDKTIAIITLYRNDKLNTRLEQKRLFLYWMNKMLIDICDYDIIVVEQSEDYPFNIGKLKNIGFDYINKITKKKYDNYIFADIDTLPDSDLIKYFFKTTDSLNALAKFGTRYESIASVHNAPFVGALISCTKEVFIEINGYGNNFFGWEGEDTNLLFRIYELKKPIYVVKKGKVIDFEEINNYKKNIVNKISELNETNTREKLVYEKNTNYKNFRENGLSNLNYTIIDEFKYEHNYHIIVDLEFEKSKKLYPHDYFFDFSIGKDEYKKFKNKIVHNIKQIEF